MEIASVAFGRRGDGPSRPLPPKCRPSKIESGDRLVTDYEVRAFAAVFGVAFENLIEDEE